MPVLARAPSLQNVADTLCVPPTSAEKWGFDGRSTGCVPPLHVAWNVTLYRAVAGAGAVGVGREAGDVASLCAGAGAFGFWVVEHAATNNAVAVIARIDDRVRVLMFLVGRVVPAAHERFRRGTSTLLWRIG